MACMLEGIISSIRYRLVFLSNDRGICRYLNVQLPIVLQNMLMILLTNWHIHLMIVLVDLTTLWHIQLRIML